MTEPGSRAHVLVAGYSTRAIAESAAHAGYTVTSVDAFADLDQHPKVHTIRVTRGFSPRAAARASRPTTCDAVAYLSSFENHPDAVRALAYGRILWGNAPAVLGSVRNPYLLAEALRRRGLATPALWGEGGGPWLLKPVASGGGTRIQSWEPGMSVPEGHYVQEFIDGDPGSVVFVASADGVRVLGLSRQLAGLEAFGASGFRYCGNIHDGTVVPGSPLLRAAETLARTVTHKFGLLGINGIDFVARGDVLYPLEVNPRWSASVELVERARGVSMFETHAQAFSSGALPDFDAVTAAPTGRSIGKAVVFARHDVTVGDTRTWCDGTIRDVPRPETSIRAGEPVCTVFADGPCPDTCRAALERRAEQVFSSLRAWAGRPR